MKNHSQDDLNKFFKSKLTDAAPGKDNWNVPPKAILNNALDHVEGLNKKKRRKNLLLALLALLLLISSFALFKTHSYVQSMEQEIETLNQTLAAIEKETPKAETADAQSSLAESLITDNKKKSNELSDDAIIIESKGDENNQIQLANRSQNSTSIQDRKANKLELKSSSIPFYSNAHLQVEESNVEEASMIAPLESINDYKTEIEQIELPEIVSLNSLQTGVQLLNNSEILLFAKPQTIDLLPAQSSRWSLSLLATQDFTCMSMSGVAESSDFNLKEYDERYYGLGLDLSLNYSINKFWRLSFLFAWDRYHNESIFNHRAAYDDTNLYQANDGSMHYNTNVFIMTPIGDYQTDAIFEIDPSQIDPSETLDNNTSISQNLSVISTGLGMSALVPFTKKSNIRLGFGALYNWIYTVGNTFDTSMSMEDKQMMHMVSNPEEMDDFSNYFISWNAELGIEYPINSSIDFIFGGQMSKSISSIRKSNVSNANTHIHNIGINIGTRIKF